MAEPRTWTNRCTRAGITVSERGAQAASRNLRELHSRLTPFSSTFADPENYLRAVDGLTAQLSDAYARAERAEAQLREAAEAMRAIRQIDAALASVAPDRDEEERHGSSDTVACGWAQFSDDELETISEAFMHWEGAGAREPTALAKEIERQVWAEQRRRESGGSDG